MSNTATVIGNIAQDPELRYTPQSKAVVTFSVADTPRNFDKASGQWVNGETDWVRVVAWEGLAENIAASIRKGNQVIVIGTYKSRTYNDAKNNNEPRTVRELHAEHVAPSLQFATAVVEKSNRRGSTGGNGGGGSYSAPAQNNAPAVDEDTPF